MNIVFVKKTNRCSTEVAYVIRVYYVKLIRIVKTIRFRINGIEY